MKHVGHQLLGVCSLSRWVALEWFRGQGAQGCAAAQPCTKAKVGVREFVTGNEIPGIMAHICIIEDVRELLILIFLRS
jgi:hypothetical protein